MKNKKKISLVRHRLNNNNRKSTKSVFDTKSQQHSHQCEHKQSEGQPLQIIAFGKSEKQQRLIDRLGQQ